MRKPGNSRRLSPLSIKVHQSATNAAFKPARTCVIHCAWCRNSETKGPSFICRKGLPMNAESCTEWKDSRKASSVYEERP